MNFKFNKFYFLNKKNSIFSLISPLHKLPLRSIPSSHSPTLLNSSHSPTLFNSYHSSPTLLNSYHSSTLFNSYHSSPLLNSSHSSILFNSYHSPTLLNSYHSPTLFNSYHSSPPLLNSYHSPTLFSSSSPLFNSYNSPTLFNSPFQQIIKFSKMNSNDNKNINDNNSNNNSNINDNNKNINDNNSNNSNKKINRLSKEKSPYLLKHQFNPVDWYPYGEEAFNEAKKQNKMIFLSIGYSTCHWCNVLAHESFENIKTAEIMNKYFINIKVDREEVKNLIFFLNIINYFYINY